MTKPIRMVDLFAGVGGFRLGFQLAGDGRGIPIDCVFASEWDKFAAQTYRANWDHEPAGDIKQIEGKSVPDHDVLTAGFPCPSFSIAGVSKRNSLDREHGFEGLQGDLFHDVARIIDAKNPRAFLLENVKNLVHHNGGRTFEIIRTVLADELGYCLTWKVLDSRKLTPTKRPRVFIAGFRNARDYKRFEWPEFEGPDQVLGSILEDNRDMSQYRLGERTWEFLQEYRRKHESAGNGFGYTICHRDETARCLSARYSKDGSEILVPMAPDPVPRKLSPRECARLMGYPDWFKLPGSNTQTYKQMGNSVVVPVVHAVADDMLEALS